MKYMGSKARFSKEILSLILANKNKEQWYVEPFAGGMNVICEVEGLRIANDKNKYLIEMWKGLLENKERPLEIPKELYDRARIEFNNKTNIEFDDFLIGWIGWMGSANGRFFDGGYSGKSTTKIGTTRNYIEESIKNIEKQIPKLKNVIFKNCDYCDLLIPTSSIIYCDIPYKGTKQYSTSKDFDYDKFWDWCRIMSKTNKVFISEYNAPDDFLCIWEKEAKSSLSANGIIGGNKISVEKLFTIK